MQTLLCPLNISLQPQPAKFCDIARGLYVLTLDHHPPATVSSCALILLHVSARMGYTRYLLFCQVDRRTGTYQTYADFHNFSPVTWSQERTFSQTCFTGCPTCFVLVVASFTFTLTCPFPRLRHLMRTCQLPIVYTASPHSQQLKHYLALLMLCLFE